MLSTGSTSSDDNQITSIEPIVYANDTLMYIINYKSSGWVVISGDKRTEPILALDESGNEELHLNTVHNGIFTWLDANAGTIYDLKQTNPIDTSLSSYKFWSRLKVNSVVPIGHDGIFIRVLMSVTSETLPSYQVGPLVAPKWGQGEPFNTCVPFGDAVNGVYPRCLTGCVAVATAQIMHYGHYKSNKPSWMYSQGSCTGFSWDNYNNYSFSFSSPTTSVWDIMRLNGGRYGSSGAHEVAILMGYIGMKVDMDFGRTGSGAQTDKVPGVLDDFSITCNEQGYDIIKLSQT